MQRVCIASKYFLKEIRSKIVQRAFYSNNVYRMAECEAADNSDKEDNDVQGQALDDYKKTLSKRALKKFERMEKWKQKKFQKKAPKSRKPGAPEPGFGAHLYDETEYYFENGLRKVYPYYYTFTTYVKRRWIGRTILEVFSTEFRAHTEERYREAIESGQLTVNGKQVGADYLLKDNELLAHRLHRHENPVVGCPLEVIVNTDELIVINKPSSIPCHPCGKYRHNSIVFIVGRQLGCSNLRNIYRLDRLTSGVLIMGKTTQKTKQLEDQILNRQVSKEYVCRVVGEFPDGTVECREPIGVISQKLGLFRVRADGKPSHTSFEKVSYNGRTSIVRCRPHTGRTHQIRVHLQFLGHPIVNDPFYNSEAWGPNKNKGGVMEKTDVELSDRLMELHNIGHWTEGQNPLYAERLREIADEKQLDNQKENSDLSPPNQSDSENIADSTSMNDPVHVTDNTKVTDSVKGDNSASADAQEPPYKRKKTDSSETPESLDDDSAMDSCVDSNLDKVSEKKETEGQLSEAMTRGSVASSKADFDKEVSSEGTKVQGYKSLMDSEHSSATSEGMKIHGSEGVSGNVDFPPFDRRKWIPDVKCPSCQQKYVDPTPSELVMYLHALRYSGPDWEYSTPLPEWAKEDWDKD